MKTAMVSPDQLPVRPPKRVVVIGASAGGIPALTRLVARLDAALDASVLVVLHVPPSGRSVLPEILSRAGPLPAAHPRDGEPLVAGHIYVAPPDRHLVLNDDTIRVTAGPWENGHRPSIDVLFRSAALWHGPRTIGVVLSGALDDGAAGSSVVAEQGGAVLVQDPDDADVREMPEHALVTVPDAMVGPVEYIAQQINTLTHEAPPVAPRAHIRGSEAAEVFIAQGERSDPEHFEGLPAGLVCPDCSGALFEVPDGRVLRYRCRVGHAWTAQALANSHGRELEQALWMALRVLEDDEALQGRMASRARDRGRLRSAARYEQLRDERIRVIELVRSALVRGGSMTDPAEHEEQEAADTGE
jgi:two-component system chemotaxis response regulator CheB